MSCSAEYWIWLQTAVGAGKNIGSLLKYFSSPRELYEADKEQLFRQQLISRPLYEKLSGTDISRAREIIAQCENNGWKIVACDDENYPELLKTLDDRPAVLYVDGDETILSNRFAVGVVGTREASDYGLTAAENVGYVLAKSGAVTVSGGALGIDSAAHGAAIKYGGKTIAFLGCGFGYRYLMSNESLRQKISENGALVSEFPPFTPANTYTFPIRNRLISGMCLGTVVVEAGERSGSMITARNAVRQGRDVFVVACDIFDKKNLGGLKLAREGATTLFAISRLAEHYESYVRAAVGKMPVFDAEFSSVKHETAQNEQIGWQEVSDRKTPAEKKTEKPQVTPKKEPPENLSQTAKQLYAVMTAEPKTADEYVMMTNLPVHELLAALTELELSGLAVMHEGKRYGII